MYSFTYNFKRNLSSYKRMSWISFKNIHWMQESATGINKEGRLRSEGGSPFRFRKRSVICVSDLLQQTGEQVLGKLGNTSPYQQEAAQNLNQISRTLWSDKKKRNTSEHKAVRYPEAKRSGKVFWNTVSNHYNPSRFLNRLVHWIRTVKMCGH